MPESDGGVIAKWFEASDARDWEAMREFMAPDFKIHMAPSVAAEPLDREAFIEMIKPFATRHEIQDQVGEGNRVAIRGVLHATLVAEFQGLPPGKEVSVPFVNICEVEEGRATEVWDLVDTLGMMQQLGAV